MADNKDPDGSIAKKAIKAVGGYIDKVFRGRPIGGDELKGASGDKPIATTLKTRPKSIDDEVRRQTK